jgi:hypothetical protein
MTFTPNGKSSQQQQSPEKKRDADDRWGKLDDDWPDQMMLATSRKPSLVRRWSTAKNYQRNRGAVTSLRCLSRKRLRRLVGQENERAILPFCTREKRPCTRQWRTTRSRPREYSFQCDLAHISQRLPGLYSGQGRNGPTKSPTRTSTTAGNSP